MTWAHTPIGSRRIIEVWPARYSPADRPSRIRAAPAKKRSSSTIGGTSSVRVMATGLPVLRDSASTRSSARASMASANRSRARLRSAGVASRQVSNASAAACSAASTSAAPETGASQVGLAGARVDDGAGPAVPRGHLLAADEVLSTVSPSGGHGSPSVTPDMPRSQRTAPTLTEKLWSYK